MYILLLFRYTSPYYLDLDLHLSKIFENYVYSTLIELADLMEIYLNGGYSVRLKNLGLFTLSATSEGFDTPEECTPRRVKAKKYAFEPTKNLKKTLKFVTFEREKR